MLYALELALISEPFLRPLYVGHGYR
jgi:hypothetical protein